MGRARKATKGDQLANIHLRHTRSCPGEKGCTCGGRWTVRVRRGLQDVPARTFASAVEAIEWRDKVLAGAVTAHQLAGQANAPTFREAAIHFLNQATKGMVRSNKTGEAFSQHTLNLYECQLSNWVLDVRLPGYKVRLGDFPADGIDEDVLELMMTAIQARASNATARAAHSAVRSVLKYAKARKFVTRVPRAVTLPPPPKPRTEFYEPDEVTAILRAAFDDDAMHGVSFTYPLVVMLYGCGGRISETLAADFTDDPVTPGIDLWSEQATWRIPREHTKTRAGARTINLDEELRAVLLAHWRALGKPPMGSPVFPGRRSLRANRGGAPRTAFRRIEAATGIRHLTAHNFRRTHSTDLAEALVPVNEATARLGQSDPAFMLRNYVQRSRHGQQIAADQFKDYRQREGVDIVGPLRA